MSSVLTKDQKLRQSFNAMRIQMQYPRFLREEVKKIADDVILTPLHQRMRNFGYSDKIIQSTRIENVELNRFGTLTFDVISDYKSENGFPVSEAREEGTDDHDLPKVPGRIYSWIAGGFIRAFSRGHRVSGITATNVVKQQPKV